MNSNTKASIISAMIITSLIGWLLVMAQSEPDAGTPTEQLNHGYVGCVTEPDLTTYNAAPHRMQIAMIVDGKCIPTADLPAHEYVILDGFLVAHVRLLLADDQYADLYVPREATMRSNADESQQ